MASFRPAREAPSRLNPAPADIIGVIDGIRLASVDDPDSAESKEIGTRFAEKGERYLAWIKKQSGGQWALVNAESGGAPYMHRINDPMSEGEPNVSLDDNGRVKAIKHVKPANLISALSLADISSSELLMRYNRGYWRVHAV